jgi:hypothetical protein
MNDLEILDPTAGEAAPAWKLAPPRVGAARVGLLDISKPQGDIFLDELGRLLLERGHSVSRHRKPSMARPATPALIRELASGCDAAVVALAD